MKRLSSCSAVTTTCWLSPSWPRCTSNDCSTATSSAATATAFGPGRRSWPTCNEQPPKQKSRNPKEATSPLRIPAFGPSYSTSPGERFLEEHQVVAAVGVPADADDVVSQGDGQMQ